MESLDQRADADLEPSVPLVRALLGLAESLDQLQQRMLTFHSYSSSPGRVRHDPIGSAAGGSEGPTNL